MITKKNPPTGALIAEGKTKVIRAVAKKPSMALICSKDDITAGDGAKHDLIEGKAAHATRTTCNVFRLLGECGLPVAFEEQVDATVFLAPRCRMLPYEVVIRREAHGSFLKRMPGLPKGHLFPQLLVEFFLKTSGKTWKRNPLLCDDPLMLHNPAGHTISLFEPSKPIAGQAPFLVLKEADVFSSAGESKFFPQMERIARQTFLALEKAWQIEGRTLVDCKIEFGLAKDGRLLLADVIDNDSWRVIEEGSYIDKQVYRDGGALDEVAEKYRRVANLTDRFRIPAQQVIIWRGSDKDDVRPIQKALNALSGGSPGTGGAPPLRVVVPTCSIHKEPVRGLNDLHRLVQQIPDSVIIAMVGRSNGAGPTLSAATTVPVITIPASYREFPDDVWSSLRVPSNVPVATILEPANAALAAIEILALRNPKFHMVLREQLEERLINTVPLQAGDRR
jgi:phosphoribosylaminoimidazole carboxylase / phosphoribosylaminoimidazole-succinocarboxamide synthase